MRNRAVFYGLALAIAHNAFITLPYAQPDPTSPWPMFRHDAMHTGRSEYAGPSIPLLNWIYQVWERINSSPALGSDGRVYFGSTEYRNLYVVNSSGTLIWSYKTGNAGTSSPALGSDGRVYVGSYDYNLCAVNSSGALDWSYSTDHAISSSPALGSDGRVYVGSYDKKLYAFNSNGALNWTYNTGDMISSSPALGSDGRVYVGSEDDVLYVLNPNGALIWSYLTGSDVTSSPALGSDGRVYIGSWDYNLYAVNSNGALNWTYRTGNCVSSSPALGSDGRVYVGSYDKKLYAVNSNGALNWSYRTGNCVSSSPALGSDGRVYVGSYDKKLYAFNSNGALNWTYKTMDFIESSPALGSDGRVYIGSFFLYCIKPGPTPTPTPTWDIRTPTNTPVAPIYYVSETTGSDMEGNGSPDNPWKTIGHAISTVTASQSNPVEVRVAAGTYTENVVMDEYESLSGGYDPSGWTRNIQVNETIIDGGGGSDARTVTAASHATVDGFTITGGGFFGGAGGIYCANADTTISHCTFTGNGAGVFSDTPWPYSNRATIRNCIFRLNESGIYTSDEEFSADDLVISGCTFENNNQGIEALFGPLVISGSRFTENNGYTVIGCGIFESTITDSEIIGNSGGVDLDGGGSLTRCIVKNNGAGISFGGEGTHGSIACCVIIGNAYGVGIGEETFLTVGTSIIARNGRCGVRVGPYSDADLFQTTITGHSEYGIHAWSSSACQVSGSIIWNNGDDLRNATAYYSDIEDGDPGTGNISADPMFANPDNDDYHLLPGSPCIDAIVQGGGSIDFEGDPRPLDGDFSGTAEYDMGADEYNPSNPPTPTETPIQTPTITPTMRPTGTEAPLIDTPTPTPTPIPLLVVDPGPLRAGYNSILNLSLNQDINVAFDFYLIADTQYGPYTLYLDGRVEKGIKAVYEDVQGWNAPFVKTVRPQVILPLTMAGKEITFYAAVIQAGRIPPVKRVSDLTPETLYVIMMDKKTATVGT